jgi:hypothetical protein
VKGTTQLAPPSATEIALPHPHLIHGWPDCTTHSAEDGALGHVVIQVANACDFHDCRAAVGTLVGDRVEVGGCDADDVGVGSCGRLERVKGPECEAAWCVNRDAYSGVRGVGDVL